MRFAQFIKWSSKRILNEIWPIYQLVLKTYQIPQYLVILDSLAHIGTYSCNASFDATGNSVRLG